MLRALLCSWLLMTVGGAIIQDYYWRYYSPGYIPDDAIAIEDGKYIGQVNHLGYDRPATIYSYDEIAVFQYAGKNIMKTNIKILCSPEPSRLYWQYVDFNKSIDGQMKEAVKGGYHIKLEVNMFIGKVYHEGEWKISNVISNTHSDKGLWIWTQNTSISLLKFYILKYNQTVNINDNVAICKR